MTSYGAGYVEDMAFLGRDVWPRVQSVAFCHDSYSCRKYLLSHRFPVVRQGSEHLGQVYDQLSVPRAGDMNIIIRTPVNTDCVPSTTDNSASGSATTTQGIANHRRSQHLVLGWHWRSSLPSLPFPFSPLPFPSKGGLGCHPRENVLKS